MPANEATQEKVMALAVTHMDTGVGPDPAGEAAVEASDVIEEEENADPTKKSW